MIPFKIYLYGGALAAIVAAAFAFAWHERDVQHRADLAQAQLAMIQALKHNQEIQNEWAAKLRAAEDRHAKELADNAAVAVAHPVGVVRVCRDASAAATVPAASTPASSITTVARGLPAVLDVPVSPGPDIGAGLDVLARSADSLVAACRALVIVR